MKHCLNCYRMLPNDAKVCHYCGTEQAEKKPLPGKKIDCCPRCMSFLYSEESGCQSCGYIHRSKRNYSGLIIAILAVLLAFFLLWQAGFLPWIPHGGKAVRFTIQEEDGTLMNTAVMENTIMSQSISSPISVIKTEINTVEPYITETLIAEDHSHPTIASTVLPLNTAEPVTCVNWVNRLHEGSHGSIISGGRSSKIRKSPSTNSELTGILRFGQEFTVEDDKPVCNEGYLWIKINTIPDQLTGWTVEADQTGYWLKPLDEKPK